MKRNHFYLLLLVLFIGVVLIPYYCRHPEFRFQFLCFIKGPDKEPFDDYAPHSQKNFEIVARKGYSLAYNEEAEQAAWVIYKLEKENLEKPKFQRTNKFKADPLIKTKTALPSDYTNSGYDRGHLAPAADLSYDRYLLDDSFYMSNISPQMPSLNRNLWKKIEDQTRRWALARNSLIVITGPVFYDGDHKIIGRQNKIWVPEAFFKVVYHPYTAQAQAFLVPNKKIVNQSIESYLTSIDQIEELTGLDFFAHHAEEDQKKLETNVTPLWNDMLIAH